MKSVLPGKSNAKLQALAIGIWGARHITVYITGNAFTILDDAQNILQTIYDDDDSELEAVAFDEILGKIATCTRSRARIYVPDNQLFLPPKWTLESTISISDPADLTTLSWGARNELLIGSHSLSLYTTDQDPQLVWHKVLSSPVYIAELSYDSAYIASCAHSDGLVKIWRRITFGSQDVRFEMTYVRHQEPVSRLQWRKPVHAGVTIENTLYTFSLDNHLRVWLPADGTQQHLQKWGSLDLDMAVEDHRLGHREKPEGMRWAFIMDERDVKTSVERALQKEGEDSTQLPQAVEHLVAVANKNPELCLVFNGEGSMSAWALENVNHATRGIQAIFNIASVVSTDLFFPGIKSDFVRISNYCDRRSGVHKIFFHYMDGRIDVYEALLTRLLDSRPFDSQKFGRLTPKATWDGHSMSITKIVRNYSGRAIVSRTNEGESFVWHYGYKKTPTPLLRQSTIPGPGAIQRICVLRKGRFVVLLRGGAVSLWDCRHKKARLMASREVEMSGRPLCLVILPRRDVKNYTVAHIATITSERKGIVWEVSFPHYNEILARSRGGDADQGSIRDFCSFDVEGEDAEGLSYVVPVDPAGESHSSFGFLDVFARDVAISYTNSGRVTFWTGRLDPNKDTVGWLATSHTETGIGNPALVSGSTLKKAALANTSRTQLTIWDIGSGRLEYNAGLQTGDAIRDLDWTSTPDKQSILAVGYQYRVVLLSQMRFDYLNKGPAWAPIREINIRDLSPHPVGDSAWLGNGHLVVGAGNQLFTYDRRIELSESLVNDLKLPKRKSGTWDLFEVVQRLSGPLPVFHPQFLSQCILAGKTAIVHIILVALCQTLKYHVEGEEVDNYLGIPMEEFYLSNKPQSMRLDIDDIGGFSSHNIHDDHEEAFSNEIALAINERLTVVKLAQLSGHEQIQLADIVECCGMVEKQRRSLDENGARFMLFFRQHVLRRGRTNEMHMSWREINWAFHSTSQDVLGDIVDRQYHGRMIWEDAREIGVFMWLADETAVRKRFEQIARNEYTKNEDKSPIDCSLFYLALKRKTILQGLWRVSSGIKEQAPTQKILANNFDEPKWRTVAMKNAYALLSKRRFRYAAAWFLLGDCLQDAVSVCLKQLKDLQLAVAITRVYEGDNGPVLKKLLEEQVLPLAAEDGNRWLASWAFWMLQRKDMAVQTLINPVYTLVETPCLPDIKSRMFLTDDPALVVLYAQLKQKTLQTLRGAAKITPRAEWDFVLHSAKLYDRMGCDLLGLGLVRNWEFSHLSHPQMKRSSIADVDPLSLVNQRRRSLVVTDIPMDELRLGGQLHENASVSSQSARPVPEKVKAAKPAPTIFYEPDANSLLDSFGF
ncbi:regulator of (H+)-ATPase in vacuolar membrane [Ceratocystis pirilliformis]|uniref:Regulator of (H+)-ATPase in vacuolar membrane n=1 Tax=Ceratocystis pirilliformis TaxID=259994 RepID=A0ABR3ZA79_9PEZI